MQFFQNKSRFSTWRTVLIKNNMVPKHLKFPTISSINKIMKIELCENYHLPTGKYLLTFQDCLYITTLPWRASPFHLLSSLKPVYAFWNALTTLGYHSTHIILCTVNAILLPPIHLNTLVGCKPQDHRTGSAVYMPMARRGRGSNCCVNEMWINLLCIDDMWY